MTESAADTVRERSSGSTLAVRLLLDIDRRVVTLGPLALVFGGIVVTSLAIDGATAALRADDPVETTSRRSSVPRSPASRPC